MNDELNQFDDLEKALKRMPLRAPSAELDARIEQALNHRPAVRWRIGFAGATLAAAAAVLLLVKATGTSTEVPTVTTPAPTEVAIATPAAKPAITQVVESEQEWSEDGIVAVESEGPVRQYRVVTTHQITEVEDGKLATMSFPQEEVYQYVSQAF